MDDGTWAHDLLFGSSSSDAENDEDAVELPCSYDQVFVETIEKEEAASSHRLSVQNCHNSKIASGLHLLTNVLSKENKEKFLQHAESMFFSPEANQAMRFGNLPGWAIELSDLIVKAAQEHGTLPPEVLCRSPVFDQIIVNRYLPGEGIKPHVDLMRFQDGIVSVSLGGPAVMMFSPLQEEDNDNRDQSQEDSLIIQKHDDPLGCYKDHILSSFEKPSAAVVAADQILTSSTEDNALISHQQQKVLLTAGDMLFMYSEARCNWEHGISAVHSEHYEGDMPPIKDLMPSPHQDDHEDAMLLKSERLTNNDHDVLQFGGLTDFARNQSRWQTDGQNNGTHQHGELAMSPALLPITSMAAASADVQKKSNAGITGNNQLIRAGEEDPQEDATSKPSSDHSASPHERCAEGGIAANIMVTSTDGSCFAGSYTTRGKDGVEGTAKKESSVPSALIIGSCTQVSPSQLLVLRGVRVSVTFRKLQTDITLCCEHTAVTTL
ncbi:hypothetical protein CEUSTIGMA_g8857.t1 [Chlamydomonas eustigma]|uniref:Fe2OG dioxygenase domain-containing protein n=1 Tax=Chlamydomonas eustigma TaxID=1157962 RepID=A0A250XEB8_9CHLO|nr:hypothetical protein CEUSTIGMA_g8857.t1 [Chlamydomonas eustigma]|eukprot:GAX81427.1 hypothetical protein CEUSTIGMA_g8857.t1 [Chlamydomonas eustigma]